MKKTGEYGDFKGFALKDEDNEYEREYPEYLEDDKQSEEQYEMVFEDKLDEATDLLYNHPESFAEIMEELRVEDREYDFDFAKAFMDNLKELPYAEKETNVLRSHTIVLNIRKAYEDLIEKYAETLTRKELGG